MYGTFICGVCFISQTHKVQILNRVIAIYYQLLIE
jgi:hypothetical protein